MPNVVEQYYANICSWYAFASFDHHLHLLSTRPSDVVAIWNSPLNLAPRSDVLPRRLGPEHHHNFRLLQRATCTGLLLIMHASPVYEGWPALFVVVCCRRLLSHGSRLSDWRSTARRWSPRMIPSQCAVYMRIKSVCASWELSQAELAPGERFVKLDSPSTAHSPNTWSRMSSMSRPSPKDSTATRPLTILCAGVTTCRGIKHSNPSAVDWTVIHGADGGRGGMLRVTASGTPKPLRILAIDTGAAKKLCLSLGADGWIDFKECKTGADGHASRDKGIHSPVRCMRGHSSRRTCEGNGPSVKRLAVLAVPVSSWFGFVVLRVAIGNSKDYIILRRYKPLQAHYGALTVTKKHYAAALTLRGTACDHYNATTIDIRGLEGAAVFAHISAQGHEFNSQLETRICREEDIEWKHCQAHKWMALECMRSRRERGGTSGSMWWRLLENITEVAEGRWLEAAARNEHRAIRCGCKSTERAQTMWGMKIIDEFLYPTVQSCISNVRVGKGLVVIVQSRHQIWQGPDQHPDGHAESCAMVKNKL
ncbi:hypothetical protein DFH09DRAFT_1506347 [Mycena vulgaris]|nr:hypothetical protein DFH09DRAFT_1506347 [Mycena vulgaris]